MVWEEREGDPSRFVCRKEQPNRFTVTCDSPDGSKSEDKIKKVGGGPKSTRNFPTHDLRVNGVSLRQEKVRPCVFFILL